MSSGFRNWYKLGESQVKLLNEDEAIPDLMTMTLQHYWLLSRWHNMPIQIHLEEFDEIQRLSELEEGDAFKQSVTGSVKLGMFISMLMPQDETDMM